MERDHPRTYLDMVICNTENWIEVQQSNGEIVYLREGGHGATLHRG